MTKLATLLIICLFSIPVFGQEEENLVTIDDLDLIIGEWHGTLTYIDYSSGEPYSMPVQASISQGKKSNAVEISITYPNEPKANNKSKIVVAKDGKSINGQQVITRLMNPSDEVEIITEESGKDDNRKARIRHTYILGRSRFINRKEVKFTEDENWLLRNEFNYRRNDL